MSKFKHINSASNHALIQASDYSISSATNRRGNDVIKINKISITNVDTVFATVKVFLDGIRKTRTINQSASGSPSDKFIFDQENVISKSDLIQVGDYVYDSNGTTLHGTITHLNPDGNNTKEIKISASKAYTDDETFYIQKPDHYITGVVTIPAGITLVLDDPFSFNLIDHKLSLTNTVGGGGTANLTIRID